MSVALYLAFSYGREPAFDDLEPTAQGRSEVRVKVQTVGHPDLGRGGRVHTVVVPNHMPIERNWDLGIEDAQGRQKVLVVVTPMQITDHLARG